MFKFFSNLLKKTPMSPSKDKPLEAKSVEYFSNFDSKNTEYYEAGLISNPDEVRKTIRSLTASNCMQDRILDIKFINKPTLFEITTPSGEKTIAWGVMFTGKNETTKKQDTFHAYFSPRLDTPNKNNPYIGLIMNSYAFENRPSLTPTPYHGTLTGYHTTETMGPCLSHFPGHDGDAASDADVCKESSIHEVTVNKYKIVVSSENTLEYELPSETSLVHYYGQDAYNRDIYQHLSKEEEDHFRKTLKELKNTNKKQYNTPTRQPHIR